MNVKYELIQQITDESIDLQVAKDVLSEAVMENPKVLGDIFEQKLNIHALCILHNSLREYSPLASLIAEQFLNKNICAESSIVRIYYSYLQKTASVHELYQAIKNGKVEKLDNPQIVVITAHKVQNLSNMGLQLLTLYTPTFKNMQIQVYQDVYDYAQFVKDQFIHIIDSYPTFSSSATISLYQIYNDVLIQDAELNDFRRCCQDNTLREPIKLNIQESLLSDFLSLSSSLMLVSANTLRPLNIPTKLLPCGGQEQQVMRYYKKFYSIS
ncbi:unnamed protein product [Paramecium primaurelia]|uniref:Uncharacterized protein n=1 Tax=Paramecium primaurelia TaxID=5886 RepID=A0A8S1PHQ5_PARPR|nr:unnamed protein product [Paramecium primaurelia]